MKLSYEIQGDLLLITVTGHYSPNESPILVQEAARLVDKHGLKYILNDFRNAKVKIAYGGIYEVNYELVQKYHSLRNQTRTAGVFSPDVGKEGLQFIENTAVNAGLNCRVFTDFSEAKKWLLKRNSL